MGYFVSRLCLFMSLLRVSLLIAGEEPPHILIIGAGVAGLSAARVLEDSKQCTVTVLEARKRTGGRIWVDESLGCPVDMGASWIHGVENNPITKLCQNYGVFTLNANYHDALVYMDKEGPLTEEKQKEFWICLRKFESEMLKLGRVGTCMTSFSKIAEKYKKDRFSSCVVKWGLRWDFEIENGVEIHQLSAESSPLDRMFEGTDYIFPNGYKQIVSILEKNIDLRLEHIVRSIEYSDEGVSVETNQGKFKGDYLICTLPLGVLKAGTVSFIPPLPEKKQKAIQDLGMGILAKVHLRFPHVFWPKDPLYFFLLSENTANFPLWINGIRYTEVPMLATQTPGAYGKSIENSSLEEVTYQCMKELKGMFGENIPQPEAVLVTSWSCDAFSEGSYSYLPDGVGANSQEDLQESVGKKLFFAGEATHTEGYGTVHGAYLSGVREAGRILDTIQLSY